MLDSGISVDTTAQEKGIFVPSGAKVGKTNYIPIAVWKVEDRERLGVILLKQGYTVEFGSRKMPGAKSANSRQPILFAWVDGETLNVTREEREKINDDFIPLKIENAEDISEAAAILFRNGYVVRRAKRRKGSSKSPYKFLLFAEQDKEEMTVADEI